MASESSMTLWQVVAAAGGVVTTLTIIGGGLWWLIGPRVRKFVESIATQVSETHRSVTVNGGTSDPSTLRDDVSRLTKAVSANTQRTERAERRVYDLGDKVDLLQEKLDEHLSNGD